MALPGYDTWKTTEPDEGLPHEAPNECTCDQCELGRRYVPLACAVGAHVYRSTPGLPYLWCRNCGAHEVKP